MKILKKIIVFILDNLLSTFTGWIIGLASVQMVTSFLEEEGWTNLWGIWSDKAVVSSTAFTLISWISTAIIGWVVMKLWNKYFVAKVIEPITAKLKPQ